MRTRSRSTKFILASAALVALCSCARERPTDAVASSSLIEGSYRVEFYQQVNGKATEIGRALVTIPADWFMKDAPSGTWKRLESASGASAAMLSGASTFVPTTEDRLTWNLHPTINDHNLQMQVLSASGEEFSGTWTFSTIAGPRDRGEFLARRAR